MWGLHPPGSARICFQWPGPSQGGELPFPTHPTGAWLVHIRQRLPPAAPHQSWGGQCSPKGPRTTHSTPLCELGLALDSPLSLQVSQKSPVCVLGTRAWLCGTSCGSVGSREKLPCPVHAMQAEPHFPGRALLENPDLALEGILGEGRGWDLLPRGRTTWARSVIHVPCLKPCFHLRGTCGGPQAAPTRAVPQCPLDCRVGTHRGRQDLQRRPLQTQQKEAGGRKGGQRTGHSGGQLSPSHQPGASQHTARLKEQALPPHSGACSPKVESGAH